MRSMTTGLLACGLGVCLATPIAGGAQAPEPAASAAADVIRTRLTLEVRPVTVSFAPALGAADAEHRALLAASASDVRVRVGEIEVVPQLRIGTLDGTAPGGSESPNPRLTTYALWLARTGAGWGLDLQAMPGGDEDDAGDQAEDDDTDSEHDEAEAGHDEKAEDDEAEDDETGEAARAGDFIGRIPLTREAAATRETFSAALFPTGEDAGQLVLRWRDHRWTADFHFADPPEPEEQEEEAPEPEEEEEEGEEEERGPRVANARESLTFDADTSAAARFMMLAERDETAVELPGDSRIAVLFWQEQSVDHEDFAALATLADGEVVRLTEAAVIRLRTERPLRFGDVTIPTGNLAPGFPGSYGLWLKRTGSAWRLVFNHEADSWGTQHDPAFDAAQIEVAYSADGLRARPLGAALVPATARDGRLVIHWGAHEWAADYTLPE